MTKPGPGKFEANDSLEVAEALYSMLGEEDDSFGDSSFGLGWYGLFLDIDVDVAGVAAPYPEGMPKHCIVEEDTRGFFTVIGEFDTAGEARMAFEDLLKRHDIEHSNWHLGLGLH